MDRWIASITLLIFTGAVAFALGQLVQSSQFQPLVELNITTGTIIAVLLTAFLFGLWQHTR